MPPALRFTTRNVAAAIVMAAAAVPPLTSKCQAFDQVPAAARSQNDVAIASHPPADGLPPETSAPPPVAASPPPQTGWWSSPPAVLSPILSGIVSLAVTWLALFFGFRNTRSTIRQKANEAELAAIEAKLGAFYGPYLQRSQENQLLAAEFHSRQPEGFRTLLSLLDPAWKRGLSPADRTIVAEIVANGSDLRSMIREHSGAVDRLVRPYLAFASVHFTMLMLADKGALDNDLDRFAPFVYPRSFDMVLQADMDRLSDRADLLRRQPHGEHPLLAPFVVPPRCELPKWPNPPGFARVARSASELGRPPA